MVNVAIVGGGPAGLMAAEVLAGAGCRVTVYDGMPSLARKLLLAGKSGLNLTHSEPWERFVARYRPAAPALLAALDAFRPDALVAWANALGADCFVGSSGRVFPKAMKASPLLRAWLRRLAADGVAVKTRHRWTGFSDKGLTFETPDGAVEVAADATLFALGGASWPRLGSNAAWVAPFRAIGVDIADFRPANAGFDVEWDAPFIERFAGAPVKSVTATSDAGTTPGEFVVSRHGIEGSLVYVHSAALRDRLDRDGKADMVIDLVPGRSAERLARDLGRQDAKASFSNRLRKGAGLDGVKAGLAWLFSTEEERRDPVRLAARLKALPIPLARIRPIEEAISSAGGVRFSAIDDRFMLKARPGVFVAGEMLDWEAPTGGYLLTGCFATGRAAASGIVNWLDAA
ncbi:Thiamine thiazole synthase [Pleomorphomonas sp. T1.2MG-36]|uniref:TIGR03862 family flavoprotein n=1 Tax=Pleomorphomonas sp. T1.2MG-36 TaxID=3041167 RepID=UPI00247737A7|nr:TIGR03862 family flavoprotein [Pleomorphomonas sp. T1.2MG-36]CAI9418317.1 Thiamine thiazole synthase [Pleomorphomonas sp. T1.2MG-36]